MAPSGGLIWKHNPKYKLCVYVCACVWGGHKITLLEQDWVYFLRNLITESVKCNKFQCTPNWRHSQNNTIKSNVEFYTNVTWTKRKCLNRSGWTHVVTALYLKSELDRLQTTSWSDVLSKNQIFTHTSLPKGDKVMIILFYSGFRPWKCK